MLQNPEKFIHQLPERLGKPLGVWRDPMKGLIWCFTSQAVFKYKVIKESRYVAIDLERFL